METHSPLPDLFQSLRRALGEPSLARADLATRLLYSTDASIYQHEPLGVVFPRTTDDLQAIVEICAAYQTPLLARGSGSSLGGQAIGPALIVDCSRHLNHILALDPEAKTVQVEPGVILNALNKTAAKHGLQFGPDPASAERASLGGCIANNATGAHSIRYGMAADHVLAADVVLSDGSLAAWGEMTFADASRIANLESGISNGETGIANSELRPANYELQPPNRAFLHAALDIRERYASAIQQRWPRTWRCASGYTLNYLLPWSASQPPQWAATAGPRSSYPPVAPGTINPARLLAGSEGTLAVIQRLTLQLSPLPRQTILGILAFPGIAEACDETARLLEYGPAAVELIPYTLVHLARSLPAYAHQLKVLEPILALNSGPDNGGSDQRRGALLAVEFAGEDVRELRALVQQLGPGVLVLENPAEQRQVWAVRKVGLGILLSRTGDRKPWSFIEDLAVPVQHLGGFVREIERILAEYGTTCEIYAHASAGCLHIRPLLDLKSVGGVQDLRAIAARAVALTISLGGSVSGEHGDGQARSEWLEQMFGGELVGAFRQLKLAADPHNLLNPGKIVNLAGDGRLPAMDSDLRFGPGYQAQTWPTSLDFSTQGGLAGAIEQCNGAGVCRKAEGVMCPSFQASGEEMHSTRGRANLLRALISGRFPSREAGEQAVYEALELCLACKGCKSECPSAVDIAKLKYEFNQRYYQTHRHPLRDYLFGYIGNLAGFGHAFAPLVNPLLASPRLGGVRQQFLGIAQERRLPEMSRHSLSRLWKKQRRAAQASSAAQASGAAEKERVLFLSDAFSEYFQPQVGLAALQALEAAGCAVEILPVIGAGRTLISKGFLEPARQHARRLLAALQQLDPGGQAPLVGVEPSEILTLRDEYLDLLPGDEAVQRLAGRAWMIDEFLIRPDGTGQARVLRIDESLRAPRPHDGVLLHGHCYQKAQPPAADGHPSGVAATVALLQHWGYQVEVIQSGCCGMAGAFGYEREHYALSRQAAELALLPAVRAAAAGTLISAAGVSCQAQIQDNCKETVKNPIELLKIKPQARIYSKIDVKGNG